MTDVDLTVHSARINSFRAYAVVFYNYDCLRHEWCYHFLMLNILGESYFMHLSELFFLIYVSNLIYKYQIKEFDIILSLEIKKMLSGIQECIKGGSIFIVESV